MSLQARVDWKSRSIALLYCAIANVKQESLQLEQRVAGLSAEVADHSAMDTSPFGQGSISYHYTAQVYIPLERSNPGAEERACLCFL